MDARVELVRVPQAAAEDVVAATAGQNAWIIGDDDEVIVIDPGEDAAGVLEQVGDREILAVICTHAHERHVAAAVEVAERDEAPVALHRADRLFWRAVHADADPEIEMAHGGRFEVADVQFEVIHTLAVGGPVPHEGDFPGFPGQLTAIGERLLDLPARTRVLPGHGEETTIGDAAKRFDGWVTAGPAGDLS